MIEFVYKSRRPVQRFGVAQADRLEDLSAMMSDVSRHFALFLALDGTALPDALIGATAKALLERGAAYVCVWGPDCERVHDLFDHQRSADETNESCVMTTWHAKDSLREALWFFAHCAEPCEGFRPACRDWVAVAVAHPEWKADIRKTLVGNNATGAELPRHLGG